MVDQSSPSRPSPKALPLGFPGVEGDPFAGKGSGHFAASPAYPPSSICGTQETSTATSA
ncbi:MAG: hypothetical protein WKF76_02215 [Nocardioidaceae bacterium]